MIIACKAGREIIRRVQQDGDLLPGVDLDTAADLLWTITSLRMWEDLALQRGWTTARYEEHVFSLLLRALTRVAENAPAIIAAT